MENEPSGLPESHHWWRRVDRLLLRYHYTSIYIAVILTLILILQIIDLLRS